MRCILSAAPFLVAVQSSPVPRHREVQEERPQGPISRRPFDAIEHYHLKRDPSNATVVSVDPQHEKRVTQGEGSSKTEPFDDSCRLGFLDLPTHVAGRTH